MFTAPIGCGVVDFDVDIQIMVLLRECVDIKVAYFCKEFSCYREWRSCILLSDIQFSERKIDCIDQLSGWRSGRL